MFACRVQGCICQNCSTTHIVFRQFAAWRDHPVGLAGRPLSSQQQAWVRFLLVLWVFFWVESFSGFEKVVLKWLHCQVPSVTGSVLGLVGLLSIRDGGLPTFSRILAFLWSLGSFSRFV